MIRRFIAKILYIIFYFKIKAESCRQDSVLAIYGHDQEEHPFEQLVCWLLSHNYEFITPKKLYSIIIGADKLDKKYVWLSFDDGWRGNYEKVFPILKKYSIPATIFVATKGVEDGYYWFTQAFQNRNSKHFKEVGDLWEMPNCQRKQIIEQLPPYKGPRKTMNCGEIKILSQSGLINFGNHTHDHVISVNCTKEELSSEIQRCSAEMSAFADVDCSLIFSYPNGNYDINSESIIIEHGFKMAVTVHGGRVFVGDNPYRLNRNEFKNGCLEENLLQIYNIWSPFFNRLKNLLFVKDKK